MGAWRPKHVEWPCRNKTCTVLHQVGVSFDLYCDAQKQEIKKWRTCLMKSWNTEPDTVHSLYIQLSTNVRFHTYEGESNVNVKYFYLVIYWTRKVHNSFIFLCSLHRHLSATLQTIGITAFDLQDNRAVVWIFIWLSLVRPRIPHVHNATSVKNNACSVHMKGKWKHALTKIIT